MRFASEDHENDPADLEPNLIDLFRYLKTPQAAGFLINVIREHPSETDDDLLEAVAQLGPAAVDPLLRLLEELGDEPGDVPFLLAMLHVRDERIFEALKKHLARDVSDAALALDIYGDAAAIPALELALSQIPPEDARSRHQVQAVIDTLKSGVTPAAEASEPFDIWALYPEKDLPHLDKLSDEERLAMLESPSAELRTGVAESYGGTAPALKVRARLIDHAKSDPDLAVRGSCWEALSEISEEPEVRRAMLGVLDDAASSLEEKAGAVVALAHQADNPVVTKAIETLYEDPRSRAKALRAMARSLDRRFAVYPARHLEDDDPEIRRQAIWGIGYLGLSSAAPQLEKFFEEDEFREDALFAYALSIPGDTSRGRIRALLNKIEGVAGGFRADEETLVQIALDQRLMLHRMKPVFFPDDAEPEEEPPTAGSSKTGRNDPCPCGSGKKYKKCCGA